MKAMRPLIPFRAPRSIAYPQHTNIYESIEELRLRIEAVRRQLAESQMASRDAERRNRLHRP